MELDLRQLHVDLSSAWQHVQDFLRSLCGDSCAHCRLHYLEMMMMMMTVLAQLSELFIYAVKADQNAI